MPSEPVIDILQIRTRSCVNAVSTRSIVSWLMAASVITSTIAVAAFGRIAIAGISLGSECLFQFQLLCCTVASTELPRERYQRRASMHPFISCLSDSKTLRSHIQQLHGRAWATCDRPSLFCPIVTSPISSISNQEQKKL
ncbi:hypothetical protein LshimejAT787_1303480 [Lyophyllum shimeji]|uniref:Uncharacterized protein n=1 Tax=Lyophyllum shimeji TaxID=47721 RepID=A0A9P3PV10_LYOSH|nr:hypothetical protein LshimejAT787_1303480 [Lyophyllum shimeji]